MGKKKNKFKEYVPRDGERYVTVVDPWGSPGSPGFLNNLGAWFELMLRDDYPGTQVNNIFTQGTHNNAIVELPSHIDINKILGTHRWCRILQPPYNQTPASSWIYEYNYGSRGDPARTNWKSNFPDYRKIDPRFPIRFPYPDPEPGPPPPPDVPWARQLPIHHTLAEGQELPEILPFALIEEVQNTEEQTPVPSESQMSLEFETPNGLMPIKEEPKVPILPPEEDVKPSFPMDHRDSRSATLESSAGREPTVKADSPELSSNASRLFKRDPYEQEQDEKKFLSMDAPQPSTSAPRIKPEPLEDDIKPKTKVKSEPTDERIEPPSNDNYQPSEALMALFRTLPPGLIDSSGLHPPSNPPTSASTSTTIMTPSDSAGPSRSSTTSSMTRDIDTPIRVKPEPEEPSISSLASSSGVTVTRTQDPRLRMGQGPGSSSMQNKRAWEGSSSPERDQPKRIKPEPEW